METIENLLNDAKKAIDDAKSKAEKPVTIEIVNHETGEIKTVKI